MLHLALGPASRLNRLIVHVSHRKRPSTDSPVHVSQEDLSVSRHHASLVFAADGTLYLTDLNSAQARHTFSNLPSH